MCTVDSVYRYRVLLVVCVLGSTLFKNVLLILFKIRYFDTNVSCYRLSYYERMVEMIPKAFESLFPAQSTEPLYKFFETEKGMIFFLSSQTIKKIL